MKPVEKKQLFCVMDFLIWFDEDDKNTGVEPMRETAIVPESWLTPQKGRSHWPPHFKKTMLKMPVDSSWPDYEVEIRSTYDTYPKARMKLSRAVETDNFESAPESQERTKRKTKVPKRLDESSSEPDESDARSFLPSPPKIHHSQKHKKDIPKENKTVVKNNQDIELDRPYSENSSSLMDSLPKQKSSNSSVEKSPSLHNISRTYMLLKKSTKRTCFMNKMKNKQYNISDDSTLRSEIESLAVASQMNHPSHDFDNRNRQVSESQLRDCTENSQVNESPPRNSAKRALSFERSPRHHNIPPPKHFKQQYERLNNNTRVMPTQRIQGNIETPASMSREQSYLFDGVN